MSKTIALLAGLGMIALFGALGFAFPGREEPLKAVLAATVSLVGAYIGIQTVNNGVKGKYWNQALYDAEHSREEDTR